LAIFVKFNTANLNSFGSIIKTLRLQKGLLLREVAAGIEVDTSMVSKFEKGERLPSREQVQKIAGLFGVPEDELIISAVSDKLAAELSDELLAAEIIRETIQKLESGKNKQRKKGK
jgi:transcriptional regulator with XRE-family HTH domain